MRRRRDIADVAIVGAGPAGSATALLLARAGLGVALIDRSTFPRPKACGDCLSPEAARVLDRLGLLDAVRAEHPALLRGWRIHSPSGHSFAAGFTAAARGDPRVDHALALPRERLDRVLVEGARAAGARLLLAHHVQDVCRDERGFVCGVRGRGANGEPFRLDCRLLIAADGLRSVIARRLGTIRRRPRLHKFSLTGHVRGVGGVTCVGEMHVGLGAVAGLAPVTSDGGAQRDAICNLTLVVDSERAGSRIDPDHIGFYWNTLRNFAGLKERLEHAALIGSDDGRAPLLASGPFDFPSRAAAVDGAVLAGDAAGYYDPFTGQGVYQALATAEILAPVAEEALRRDIVHAAAFREYERGRRKLLRGARRLQQVVEFATSRPRVADAAIRRLGRSPELAETLIAATGDLRPASSLLAPRLLLSAFRSTRSAEALP